MRRSHGKQDPNFTWTSGTFNDSIKGWQQQWFYVTEPRDTKWAAAPEFRSGAPLELTSWPKKGLNWSSPYELSVLQTHVKDMEDKDIKLVNVVQVMLVRRILVNTGLAIYGNSTRPSTRPCESSLAPHTKISGRCFLSPANHGQTQPRTAGTTCPAPQVR